MPASESMLEFSEDIAYYMLHNFATHTGERNWAVVFCKMFVRFFVDRGHFAFNQSFGNTPLERDCLNRKVSTGAS